MRSTLLLLLAAAGACTDSGSTDSDTGTDCIPSEYAGAPLTIAGVSPEIDLQPGATKQLDVSLFVGNGQGAVPLGSGCEIAWSVTGTGATVDEDGTLVVDAASPSGSKRTVKAAVNEQSGGGHVGDASVEVWTYTPEAMPQLGTWHEATRTDCTAFAESAPPESEKINELVVFASGLTWVTWQPFEVYIDYWATAAFHAPAVSLSGVAGNYIPTDSDLDGDFSVENGDLVLTNMFLGTRHPSDSSGAASNICGHRFTKN